MTRFVYVLPAGRFRWEVRIEVAPLIEAAAAVMYPEISDPADDKHDGWYLDNARDAIEAALPEINEPQFYRRKSQAEVAARAIAIIIGGEVQPHDRRGRIQDPDSYGGDSPRRRG